MKFNTIFLCLLLFVFCTCTDKKETISQEVIFNVAITDVEDYSAIATITHNGTNRDCYYGFVTKGNVDDVQLEINKFLSTSNKDKILSSLKNQRKKVIPISGLSPKKTYTYIAFGLDEEGKLYGIPACAKFTTTVGQFVAVENPNWEIEYQGPDLFNNGYYSKFHVGVIGDPIEHYFVYDCKADFSESFESEEDLIIHAIEEFKEQHLDEDQILNEDFWINESFVFQGSYFYYHVLDEGEYVAYAIGINLDGTPTGHYVKTPVFQVNEYPAVEDYTELLTNSWQITDLYNDSILYDITFEKLKVNQSLLMHGWGDLPYPLVVKFNQNESEIILYSQLVSTNVTLNLNEMDVTGDLYIKGYWDKSNNPKGGTLTTEPYALTTGTRYSSLYTLYGFSSSYYISSISTGVKFIDGITYVLHTKDEQDIVLENTKIDIPFYLKKKDNEP